MKRTILSWLMMATCHLHTSSSSSSSSHSATTSPITDLILDEYSLPGSMSTKRSKQSAGFLDEQSILQTLQVERLSPRNTPSLAVTRSNAKRLADNLSYHGAKSRAIDGKFPPTLLHPRHGDSDVIHQNPIPTSQTLGLDWTDRAIRHRTSFKVDVPNYSYEYPQWKNDTRNGFWKTVTRPTPGELSLKYRNKANHRPHNSNDSIYKSNDKDPDEIDTNFVMQLLEDKQNPKEIEDKLSVAQENSQKPPLKKFLDDSYATNSNTHSHRERKHSYPFDARKSVNDHVHRLNVLRSQEDARQNHVPSLDGGEKRNGSSGDDQSRSALERFSIRLNSRSSTAHRHNRTLCAECIPNVPSSRLLGALDSYRRKDGIEKSNLSLQNNVNEAHARNARMNQSRVTAKAKVRGLAQSRRPEILVKFDDGPDYLKTIRIPDNVQLPSIAHPRKPEALLKLSQRREMLSKDERDQTQTKNLDENLDDGSYPGFFTFSSTVRPVTTPANTPVLTDGPSKDDTVKKKDKIATSGGKVVNVMTHGKGALIIQHHKEFKSAKMDIFLPQAKLGKD